MADLVNSGNWGYQVPALVQNGYRAILIDSRGHGRSTRDSHPYTYELMASDVLAAMDALVVEKAALIGWSDGACTSLILGAKFPDRAAGVFFFGCNMDPTGVNQITEPNLILDRCLSRHKKDYRQLSATPDLWPAFFEAVGLMQRTQPNYSARDLSEIKSLRDALATISQQPPANSASRATRARPSAVICAPAYGSSILGKIGVGWPSTWPAGKAPHCKLRILSAPNWPNIFRLVPGSTGLTRSANSRTISASE